MPSAVAAARSQRRLIRFGINTDPEEGQIHQRGIPKGSIGAASPHAIHPCEGEYYRVSRSRTALIATLL